MGAINKISPQLIGQLTDAQQVGYSSDAIKKAVVGYSARAGLCDQISGVAYKIQQLFKAIFGCSDFQKALKELSYRQFIQLELDDNRLDIKISALQAKLEQNKNRPYAKQRLQETIFDLKYENKALRKEAITKQFVVDSKALLNSLIKDNSSHVKAQVQKAKKVSALEKDLAHIQDALEMGSRKPVLSPEDQFLGRIQNNLETGIRSTSAQTIIA